MKQKDNEMAPNKHYWEWVLSRDKLSKLFPANTPIYLTGSHFFGGSNPESDFDFFMSDSLEARNVLTDAGYTVSKAHKYIDGHCMAVYTKAFLRTSIDVQLVDDCQAKHRAQEILKLWLDKTKTAMCDLSKEQSRLLWVQAYLFDSSLMRAVSGRS